MAWKVSKGRETQQQQDQAQREYQMQFANGRGLVAFQSLKNYYSP